MRAETRARAEREIAHFATAYGAKYPKAGASLRVDQERLLAYFAYPAEHWKHLRTTNPIESTFATVRLREGVTKGAGSRTAGLVMAFKLLLVAEGHWRHVERLMLDLASGRVSRAELGEWLREHVNRPPDQAV